MQSSAGCSGVECKNCGNKMIYSHYLNHLQRCKQWAEIYSRSGCYNPEWYENIFSNYNQSSSSEDSPDSKEKIRFIDETRRFTCLKS